MKIRVLLLVIATLMLVSNCSESRFNKKESVDEMATKEDFNIFLENFSHKPTFQRQRVLFPIEATLLVPTDMGMQTIKEDLEYQDWILLDFTYDDSYSTRDRDKYKQQIRLYEDSAFIELRGIDNGIYENYFFTNKDGKWFLKSFTDASY